MDSKSSCYQSCDAWVEVSNCVLAATHITHILIILIILTFGMKLFSRFLVSNVVSSQIFDLSFVLEPLSFSAPSAPVTAAPTSKCLVSGHL